MRKKEGCRNASPQVKASPGKQRFFSNASAPDSALAREPGLAYNEPMYQDFAALIACHEHIGIISHHNPDGDAIGSTLALGLALRAQGKQVRLFNQDGVPQRFAFLPGAELIESLPGTFPSELSLLIVVDSGDEKRLGDAGASFFAAAPATANVDHHATNTRYGELNIVEGEAAACGCVLMQMFRALGWELTQPIATALYVAINTDTGSFQYASTTAEVMRMGAELLELGVDVAEVNRLLYQEVSPGAIAVQREVLNNMGFLATGAVSFYKMSLACKESLGVGQEATKDLVDIIRVIRGVRVAAIFEEVGNGRVRISLRSKDARVNVAQIALRFGGGGHALAAGIRMCGTLEEVSSTVLEAIVNALPED